MNIFVFFSFLRHFPIFSPMLPIFSFLDPRRYFPVVNVGNIDCNIKIVTLNNTVCSSIMSCHPWLWMKVCHVDIVVGGYGVNESFPCWHSCWRDSCWRVWSNVIQVRKSWYYLNRLCMHLYAFVCASRICIK